MSPISAFKITHINADNVLIKIFGVTDQETFHTIHSILDGYKERLKSGLGYPKSHNDVLPGTMVLVPFNNEYRRAQIIKLTTSTKILVRFVDYGSTIECNWSDARKMDVVGHLNLLPVTSLVSESILHGAVKRGEWTPDIVAYINHIVLEPYQVQNVSIVNSVNIVEVFISDPSLKQIRTLSEILISENFANNVSLDQLYHHLGKSSQIPIRSSELNIMNASHIAPYYQDSSITPKLVPPQSLPGAGNLNYHRLRTVIKSEPQPVISQYKVDTLPVGSEHEVVVSHVIEGMQCFTVQVKKMRENILTPLMAEINEQTPIPFTEPLQPGTKCLARSPDDNIFCRAVVSTVLAEGANVYLVDFGSSVTVNFSGIYQIPPQFLVQKVLALRFTLAEANTPCLLAPESQQLFKNIIVNTEPLIMKVTKPECPLKQYCELFCIESGRPVNIKTKIVEKSRLIPAEYKNTPFKKGNTSDVIVSYVESPFKFFVQLEVNQPMLQLIMKSVEKNCIGNNSREILYMEDVNDNMAVYAQYSEDQKWYRGLIVGEADPNGNVQIFFVDYGNQETTHFSKLHMMNNEMIADFPKQAIECRLDTKYEFAMRDDVIDYFMEFVDGHTFQMKVINVLPNHTLLVDLIDESGVNVKDKLEKHFELKRSQIVAGQPQGGWRERNNHSNNDGSFSAFRKHDARPSRDFDETDNVKNEEFWGDSKRDRTARKFDRNDSKEADRKVWRNDNDQSSGWPRRNSRNDGESEEWSSRKPRREDPWNNRGGDGSGRSHKPREDKFHKSEGEWNTRNDRNTCSRNHDNFDNGGSRSYRDAREKDGWLSRERNSERSFKSRDRDDDWPGNNDRDRQTNKSHGDTWEQSGKNSWDDRSSRPWEKLPKNDRSNTGTDLKDNKNENGNWGSQWKNNRNENYSWASNRRNDRGSRQRTDDSNFNNSRTDKWSSNTSLEPPYDKGAQFLEYEYHCGQTLEVNVSWFVNPAQFYVIPVRNDEFRQLMETIQDDYPKRESVDLNTVSPNDCLVARDKDNVIYRAQFLRGRPGGALVNFVDYGNKEIIKKDQAWIVSSSHCVVPVQAVCCKLHNVKTADENTPWSQIEGLDEFFGKDLYTLTFVECHEEANSRTWSVQLKNDENQDVGEQLVAAGLAVNECTFRSEHLYDPYLLRNQILAVFTGVVISSQKFYVHIEPEKISKLKEDIVEFSKIPTNLRSLTDDKIVVGAFCLASAEKVYFRAKITSIDVSAGTAHVVFIDYGDEDDVPFNDIKALPVEFAIFNPQIMECCIYGEEKVSNEDEFIDTIIEKDLLIKVVDVIDNKLHVVLYDTEGNRLPFPRAVTESVSVIHPLPVLKNTDIYVISHVNRDQVFIQRAADENSVNEMPIRLGRFYDTLETEKVALQAGLFYAAKSSQYEAWFRCTLMDKEDCPTVFYIDYGDTEKVEDLLVIKPLDKQFYDVPMLALAVSTSVNFTDVDLKPVMDAVGDILFEGTLRSIGCNKWFADLKCEKSGKTLSQFAAELSCGEEIPIDGNPVTPYSAFDDWKVSEERIVRVVHVNSPDRFYIQLVSDEQKIKVMHDSLQDAVKNLLPIVGPYDEKMAAMNPFDQKWYRVISLNATQVFAIDFGFIIESPVLKKLPSAFLNEDKYIASASMNIQPLTETWNDDVLSRVSNTLTVELSIITKLLFVQCNLYHVEINVDGNNIAEALVNDGAAKSKGHSVTISHASSLTNFYIQFLENEEISNLIEKLKDAERWEIADPEVGELVCAQFFEDDLWYRAEVMKIENGSKYVKFIDYGNEAEATHFRVLPKELQLLPRNAVWCTLSTTSDFNDFFTEFVITVEGSYTVYFLRGEDPILVALEFDGEPIEKVLSLYKSAKKPIPTAEVGETVFVKYINSPSSFFVENENTIYKDIEITLQNIEMSPPLAKFTVGDYVAAKFPEDGVWYRAKVMDTTNGTYVLFVDYGNSCMVEELRALPEAARTIKQSVKHCAFTLLSGFEEWPKIATARFNELSCDGNTAFKIKVEKDGDPAIVDLCDSGTSVVDELATLCKAELTTFRSVVGKETAVLSHIGSDNTLWVQIQTPQLDEMMNEMANADTFEEKSSAESGSLVAAPFENAWYRAKVIENKNGFKVLFIDYGNEIVTNVIKSLPEDLANLPPLANCCKLKNFTEWSKSVIEKLEEFVVEATNFHVTELCEHNGECTISLRFIEDGNDLTDMLMNMRDEKKLETESSGVHCSVNNVESGNLLRNKDVVAEVIESSTNVFGIANTEGEIARSVAVLSHVESINSETSYINTEKVELPSQMSVPQSDSTVIPVNVNISHTEDKSSLENDVIGNAMERESNSREQHNSTTKNLHEEDNDKFETPMSKFPEDCSSPEKLDESIESDKSRDSFYETLVILNNESAVTEDSVTECKAELITTPINKSVAEIRAVFESKLESEEKTILKSEVNNESHTMTLSNTKSAESEEVKLLSPDNETSFDEDQFVISQIGGPNSFYVYRLNDKNNLKAFERALPNFITMECVLENANVGDIVAAEVQGVWLRGEIIDGNNVEGYTLKCIDSGHKTKVNEVYSLTEKIKSIPPWVHHCSLQKPENIEVWPDIVCQQFENCMLVKNSNLRLKVIEEKDDVKIVELSSETENISKKMIAMCCVREASNVH